jgi:Na+-transporting NADH:ubiquinone oxidoreductase subunit C
MARDSIRYTVAFTFLVTFLIVCVLSVAHSTTVERVAAHDLERYRSAVERSAGVEAYAHLERYADGAYRYLSGDRTISVRRFRGAGVWGEIVGILAVDPVGNRVVGIEILHHNETPGLGGRVAGERFLRQLRGERIGDHGIRVVIRGPGNDDPDDATIDGITGATGTTRAFDAILNREVRAMLGESSS